VIYITFDDPGVHRSFAGQAIVLGFDSGEYVNETAPVMLGDCFVSATIRQIGPPS